MAITNNGMKNNLSIGQLPSGYSRPTVTDFTDEEYTNELNLIVLKSAVENVSNSVTMAAIITNLDAQVDAILAADYLATATVDAWAELIQMESNQRSIQGDSEWLDNSAINYVCKVKLYVKTA